MEMNNLTRRLAAWIACFAILLAVLAPSISQAVHIKKGAEPIGEICSMTGSKMVKAETGSGSPTSSMPAEKGLHFDHCPFCFTHAGSFVILPSEGFALPAETGTQLMPSLYYHAPRPLFIWAAAHSRAPPSLF